jgi:hypothetical protein
MRSAIVVVRSRYRDLFLGVLADSSILALDPLDLVALHHGGKDGTSLHKELMMVRALVGSIRDSLKVIKVQLSLEATELVHTKMPIHDKLDKVSRFVNRKGSSMREKRGDLLTTFESFQLCEHLVQLLWKSSRSALTTAIDWKVRRQYGRRRT